MALIASSFPIRFPQLSQTSIVRSLLELRARSHSDGDIEKLHRDVRASAEWDECGYSLSSRLRNQCVPQLDQRGSDALAGIRELHDVRVVRRDVDSHDQCRHQAIGESRRARQSVTIHTDEVFHQLGLANVDDRRGPGKACRHVEQS